MFLKNECPLTLFESVVKRFLENSQSRNTARSKSENGNVKTLVLSYLGRASRVLEMRSKHNVSLQILCQPFKIGMCFSLKSKCPKLLQFMIVYKATCSVDQNVTYIVKTKRHFGLRKKICHRHLPLL